MIPLFLGMTAGNLLLLLGVFVLGLFADGGRHPAGMYNQHVAMAMAGGLMALLTHCVVYTYFMGTTKWLAAAADKAGLDLEAFVATPSRRKSRAFRVIMGPVCITMITMVGGAAADTIPGWPKGLHLFMGAATLAANLVFAFMEHALIREQAATMDDALARLQALPGVQVRGG